MVAKKALSHSLLFCLFVSLAPLVAYADTEAAPSALTIKLQYSHTQPNVDTLPTPGLPLTLTVQTNKDVLPLGMKVRAIITRDGVLTEVQDQEPRIDALEKVFFDIEIPSPLAELTYQFVFTDKTGNAVTTRRYKLARKCIPAVIGSIAAPDDKGQITKDDARVLKETADHLDEEIQLYEKASQMLTAIQEAIDKK